MCMAALYSLISHPPSLKNSKAVITVCCRDTTSIIEAYIFIVYIFPLSGNGGVQYYFNYKRIHAYYFIVIS